MVGLLLLFLVGLLSLVFLYLNYTYHHWQRKGLPQPPTVLGFGNFLDIVLGRSNLGLLVDRIYRAYPEHEAVGVYGFLTPKLLLRSPELIRRVLVSDFSSFQDNEIRVSKRLDPHLYLDPFCLKGEEWKPARVKIAATASGARVKEIFPLMKEVVTRMHDYIDEHSEKEFEAGELAGLFTMDNVSHCVFGITSNCFTDPRAAFRRLADIQARVFHSGLITAVLFMMPTVRDFLGMRLIPKEVAGYVEDLVENVKNFRQKNNIHRNDLFQYFMKKDSGGEDMMFYAMTFFIEGFESSTMVVRFALYELALNPGVQETLYREIRDSLVGNPDPDYDTLGGLPYLDKVMQETLRKYPVGYSATKVCTKPITLDIDGTAVDIEVGTPVLVPVFSLHHDPQYYPRPEVFDPERFSEDRKAARPPYTYMPFGEGPRMCPGSRFAMAQMKLFLFSVVSRYRVVRSERTPGAITFSRSSSLVAPNEQLWIRLEGRPPLAQGT